MQELYNKTKPHSYRYHKASDHHLDSISTVYVSHAAYGEWRSLQGYSHLLTLMELVAVCWAVLVKCGKGLTCKRCVSHADGSR